MSPCLKHSKKALNGVIDGFGLRIGADGSIVNKSGEAVTKNELDQIQKSLTNGTQFDRNFTQSKEDFIRSEVFKGLTEPEMKKSWPYFGPSANG